MCMYGALIHTVLLYTNNVRKCSAVCLSGMLNSKPRWARHFSIQRSVLWASLAFAQRMQ